MFCWKCGVKVNDEARYCHSCGSRVGQVDVGSRYEYMQATDVSVQYKVSDFFYVTLAILLCLLGGIPLFEVDGFYYLINADKYRSLFQIVPKTEALLKYEKIDFVYIMIAFVAYAFGIVCAVTFVWDAISRKFNKAQAVCMTVNGFIYLLFMCLWGGWYEFEIEPFTGISVVLFLVGLITLAFVEERGEERKRRCDSGCLVVQILMWIVLGFMFLVYFMGPLAGI